MNHRLITFEGIEGVGKSTVIAEARRILEAAGKNVVLTREPGGTANAELVRSLVLHPPQQERWEPKAELLLMFASRVQHVEQLIKPALASGAWVLCDRFADASYAYQGAGRGIDDAKIDALYQWCLGAFAPGLTVLMDAPIEVSVARMQKRATDHDRIESETVVFFERVRNKYLALAEQHHDRFVCLDANRPLAEIYAELAECLIAYMGQSHAG
jgi:dTMP kinase